MFSQFLYTPALAVLGVTLFGAPFLLWPHTSQAVTIPSKISLSTGDTVRVLEPEQFRAWFTVGQSITFNPQLRREIESTPSVCTRFPFFCDVFVARQDAQHFVSVQTFQLNDTLARPVLEDIFDDLERDPINAKLGLDDQGALTVISESVPGIRIDHTKSLEAALALLAAPKQSELTLSLQTELVPAKVSGSSIHALGLSSKIAEAKTNFRGSPKNRIFNIHRAIEQFDGIVLAPGEEFSFVDHLGEVDGEHGYLPELVIKNNKTEPEFGGGICQVSTTVFRTALYAGLEITERRNHAYPVQYYKPYGMDATIYIPRPDLKFKNNTPGSILMLPKIVGTELSFSFYGTSDGRSVAIDGPHILESNPDGSMRTIFTQTVKDKEGTAFINATFPSNYKSPSLFPHPGEEVLTVKPKDWSNRQWKEYKAIHP